MATSDKQLITTKQQKLIAEKTPERWIKQRRGPSGLTLDYVEAGYVVQKLNEIFNYLWDFEVIEEKIGKKQVYVRGRLTAYISPELKITKSQYGGNDIKFLRGTSDPVSIADDLKAASSDALKKCASLFGIAADVYWKSGAEYYSEHHSEEPEPISEEQRKLVFALLTEKGKTKEDLDAYISAAFKKMSIQVLTKQEGSQLIEKLESLPEPQDDTIDPEEVDKALQTTF